MKKDRRLFARLDLDYADHPKIAGLSDAAFRAHVEMILYARKYLTDGRIPNRVANRFGSESLTELTTNDEANPSLVAAPGGDFILHGFADMQETRAEVDRKRQVNRENGSKGGRPKKTHSVSGSGTQTKSETKPETETETETDISLSNERDSRAKRGERLEPDWMPDRDLIAEMQAECPGVDLQAEHKVFIDYWIAQPGQKGVKLDWPATWRNWMRRKQNDARHQKLTPTQRAQQTAAAGRNVAGLQITSLESKGIEE